MHNRVLVAGGSGFVGRTVVRRLQRDGFSVRILSRHPERALTTAPPGSEVVFGDVTRPETIEDTITGCRFLCIALSGQTEAARFFAVEHDGVANLAHAAAAAGIERIAMVSGAGVSSESTEYFVRAKYLGERVLLDQDIPAAIFRSSWFMESLPRMIAGPIAAIPGPQPHPVHFIALSDLASMISRSLLMPEPPSGVFYAYGPETMTVTEALKRYCHSYYAVCPVISLPGWVLGFGAQALGGKVQFIYDLTTYLGGVIEPSTPGEETLRLFGPNPTTLDDWLDMRDHGH